MAFSLTKRCAAEALATAFLLATVIGSGVMGAKLSGGNIALALLGNTIPTGAMLAVLILVFGPVSGAHMNPAMSVVMAATGRLPWRDVPPYIVAQVLGALLGVIAAHAMFELPLIQIAQTSRTGTGQWIAEAIATFGLGVTVLGCLTHAPQSIAYAVGLYITAAYWFTASTSFANPAVTIARALSETFAGIAPAHVPAFIAAQLIGVALLLATQRLFWPTPMPQPEARAADTSLR